MLSHRARSCLISVLGAAVVVFLVWGVVGVVVGAQEDGPQRFLTPAMDSVTFDAEFRAEDKAPEVVARRAESSATNSFQNRSVAVDVEGENDSASWQEGDFSFEGGVVRYSAEACADGGDGSCSNSGDMAGASISEGEFYLYTDPSLLGLGVDAPAVGFTTDGTLTTEARCYLDEDDSPRAVAERPDGTVRYGSGGLFDLISTEGSFPLSTLGNGEQTTMRYQVGGPFEFPGTSHANIRVTASWGSSLDGRGAYSEIELGYMVESRPLSGGTYTSGWHDLIFRSECGLDMGDEASMSPFQAPRQVLDPVPRVDNPPPVPVPSVTSAPGSPRTFGFSDEDRLSLPGMDYHLLATRELDGLDHLDVEAVLTEIAASGDVEGPNWALFDAEAAGELVPVVEVELFDGAIVQARPIVAGVSLPVPDVVPAPSVTISPTTSPTTAPEGDEDDE